MKCLKNGLPSKNEPVAKDIQVQTGLGFPGIGYEETKFIFSGEQKL